MYGLHDEHRGHNLSVLLVTQFLEIHSYLFRRNIVLTSLLLPLIIIYAAVFTLVGRSGRRGLRKTQLHGRTRSVDASVLNPYTSSYSSRAHTHLRRTLYTFTYTRSRAHTQQYRKEQLIGYVHVVDSAAAAYNIQTVPLSSPPATPLHLPVQPLSYVTVLTTSIGRSTAAAVFSPPLGTVCSPATASCDGARWRGSVVVGHGVYYLWNGA